MINVPDESILLAGGDKIRDKNSQDYLETIRGKNNIILTSLNML